MLQSIYNIHLLFNNYYLHPARLAFKSPKHIYFIISYKYTRYIYKKVELRVNWMCIVVIVLIGPGPVVIIEDLEPGNPWFNPQSNWCCMGITKRLYEVNYVSPCIQVRYIVFVLDVCLSVCLSVCSSPKSCPIHISQTAWRIFMKLGSHVHLIKATCRTRVSTI